MDPIEALSLMHKYRGCGSGSPQSVLKHIYLGEGITTYSGFVPCAENMDNIKQLINDLSGGDIKVLGSTARAIKALNPEHEFVHNINNNGTYAIAEGTYILKNRSIVFVNQSGPKSWSAVFDFFHTDLTEQEAQFFAEYRDRENAKKVVENVQRIFMLVDYGNGDFNFHDNKIPLSEFKIDNYSKENSDWMPKLKDRLFNPTTTGRLTILQGPAGTGKTRFLRALFQELGSDVCPIVLPVSLAGELSQPRMLGQITANEDFENKKLLLVIEDGDQLLEKRERSSSVISDFLNIVDGLVGEIVNLHVIVTTNLQKKDFDPAITRPGRLHSILYFDSLNKEQAATVYKRETGEEMADEGKESYTLAEVYALTLHHKNGVREKKISGAGQYL